MRRVIAIDTRRTFGKVVIWEDGRLRHVGRVDVTRTALEGFGRTLLATMGDHRGHWHCTAVSRVLALFVKGMVDRQPAAGQSDRARSREDPTRSTPARWPACTQPATCGDLDTGCRHRVKCAGWSRGAT